MRQTDLNLLSPSKKISFVSLGIPTQGESAHGRGSARCRDAPVTLYGLGHELRDIEFWRHEPAPRVLRASGSPDLAALTG